MDGHGAQYDTGSRFEGIGFHSNLQLAAFASTVVLTAEHIITTV